MKHKWTDAEIEYFRGKKIIQVDKKVDYVWWGLFGLYMFMVIALVLVN